MPCGLPAPTRSVPCVMNRALLFFTSPLLAVLLAGCSTPIPHALPDSLQPKSFSGPAVEQAKPWPEPLWWQGFGDPQLSALEAEAEQGNRDIAMAAARVLQAQAQSTIQRAALFPQIDAQAN